MNTNEKQEIIEGLIQTFNFEKVWAAKPVVYGLFPPHFTRINMINLARKTLFHLLDDDENIEVLHRPFLATRCGDTISLNCLIESQTTSRDID